jgi:RNA recognition motif-containing protein
MTKKKEIQELGGSKSEDIEMSDSEEDCIEAVNDQERTEVGEAIEAEQNDRPAEKDPRARTVFVKNLPSTFIAKNVTRLFKRYGRIDAVKIRGLKGASEPVKAYILFQSLDSVAKALKL